MKKATKIKKIVTKNYHRFLSHLRMFIHNSFLLFFAHLQENLQSSIF